LERFERGSVGGSTDWREEEGRFMKERDATGTGGCASREVPQLKMRSSNGSPGEGKIDGVFCGMAESAFRAGVLRWSAAKKTGARIFFWHPFEKRSALR
jgi:hypothetical protein